MERTEKQVVLVTGCSEGGIGHALSREFAANGCLVVATSRSLRSMRDLDHDHRFYLQELDVTSDESVGTVVSNVIEKYGKIDILVNNAGVMCVGPVAEIPLSAVQDTFNTNVFGAMRLVQAVVPHMASKKQGKIVNVGSVGALITVPWVGSYIATKAALHTLTNTMRLELKSLGIDVVSVVPGALRSNVSASAIARYEQMPEWKFYKSFDDAMRRTTNLAQVHAGSTEEFAKYTVAQILKKRSPSWFSWGPYCWIMAIMYHLPICVTDFMARRMYM